MAAPPASAASVTTLDELTLDVWLRCQQERPAYGRNQIISQQFHYAKDSIVCCNHGLVEYNAALASVRFLILLGFVDDILDVPCRVKLVLPTIAALPLLMAYNGGQLHGNVRMGIGELCQWELQCYQNYADVRKRKRGIDDTEMPRGDATGYT
ncbi:hypothetical protein U9M48_008616, partial [Paspalum notatum var. saurae]